MMTCRKKMSGKRWLLFVVILVSFGSGVCGMVLDRCPIILKIHRGFRLCWYFSGNPYFVFHKNVCQVSRYRTSLKPIQKALNMNHRKCQKSHSGIISNHESRAKPGLWLVAYTKKAELEKRLCLLKLFETISKHFKSF